MPYPFTNWSRWEEGDSGPTAEEEDDRRYQAPDGVHSMKLTDQQILRLAALSLADDYGEEAIPEGAHHVDARVSLHLKGTIEQAAPQLAAQNPPIPLAAVLALVAEKAGIKAEALYDLIVEAAEKAIETGVPITDWMTHTQRGLSVVQKRLSERLGKKPKKGPLKRIMPLDHVRVTLATVGVKNA